MRPYGEVAGRTATNKRRKNDGDCDGDGDGDGDGDDDDDGDDGERSTVVDLGRVGDFEGVDFEESPSSSSETKSFSPKKEKKDGVVTTSRFPSEETTPGAVRSTHNWTHPVPLRRSRSSGVGRCNDNAPIPEFKRFFTPYSLRHPLPVQAQERQGRSLWQRLFSNSNSSSSSSSPSSSRSSRSSFLQALEDGVFLSPLANDPFKSHWEDRTKRIGRSRAMRRG